jgi:hypothetical protein
MRMPLPPPPAEALIRIGKPMISAARMRSSSESPPSVPGMMGTPRALAILRAVALSPMAPMARGGGPMKTMPASSQASAKSGRSARNP